MRVLYVSPWFFPASVYGGPIESSRKMCLALSERGHSVEVLTTSANGKRNLPSNCGGHVDLGRVLVRYCARIGTVGVFSIELLLLLPGFVRRADVIHLSYVYSFPTMPTLFCALVLQKPVLWCPRGAMQSWDGTRRMWAKKWWLRLCALIAPRRLHFHVTSVEEREDTIKFFPGRSAHVIPNGLDCVNLAPKNRTDSQYLRILFLGRLDVQKGIERLIEACSMLDDSWGTNWTLVIAGPGDDKYRFELVTLASQLRLGERVKFMGLVEGPEKELVFECSDILVLPSYRENFGNVVVEALARGIPVIASQGTPWKILEDRGCGLWVENSPESLRDALMRMSRLDLNDCGRRGRELVEERYGWDGIVDQVEEAYNNVRS